MKKIALLVALLFGASLFGQNNEVMEITQMQLHKGPPAVTTLDVLTKHFAKTDSIVDAGDDDCVYFTTETDTYERYYFNGIVYMVKNKQEAFLYSIDFVLSGIEITNVNISLSKETSFIQFIKVYRSPNMETVNGQKRVYVFTGYESDDKWMLVFEKSKLIAMRYLSDC